MARAATARSASAGRAARATTAARAATARPHRRLAPKPRRLPRRYSGHARPLGRTVALPRGARVLDALLTGRAWIALVGVLLAGIVFFNVDLLQMNREITQMADRAAQLKRENARMRLDYARLASSERIQETAAELGLVLPAPDEVRYLDSNPRIDARNASKRIIAPSSAYVPPEPVTAAPDPATTAPTTGATDPATVVTDPATTGAADPATTAPVTSQPGAVAPVPAE